MASSMYESQKTSSVDSSSKSSSSTSNPQVSIDKSRAVKVNKSYGYSRETWKEIQRSVGLTGSDVDGYVGPQTVTMIAIWQAKNGLEVDGICGPKSLAAMRSGEQPKSSEPENKEEAKDETASEDWQQDLVKAGLSKSDIYTGESTYSYGSGDKSVVKTLQALLNRSLKKTSLGTAAADGFTIGAAGSLSLDGSWGLNSATHLMYFIDMAGYSLVDDNYISKFKVKCDSNIWKDLRSNKSLDVARLKQHVTTPLSNIPGTSHKIVQGGEKAYLAMQKAAGYKFSIKSSFRAFSSHGMSEVGLDKYSGQLELFALRIAGKRSSDCAKPTHSNTNGGNHMTGKALDIGDGKSYFSKYGKDYGFTGIASENWHFNFNPDTWASSPKNK